MRRDQAESVRKTLGLQSGVRVWVGGHNLAAKRVVEPLLVATTRPPTGPIEIAFVTAQSTKEAAYFLGKIEARLERGGVAWLILPPDASPNELSIQSVEAALAEFSETLRLGAAASVALPNGFVACAFDLA